MIDGLHAKSEFRFEINRVASSGRCKVEVYARVPDGGNGESRWERIGVIQAREEMWEKIESALILGVEAGVVIEVEDKVMVTGVESEWAKARREAQESAVKSFNEVVSRK